MTRPAGPEGLFLAAEDPRALAEAWTAARDGGPAWRDALDGALAKPPDAAARVRLLP